jgi:hypothetical protein
MSHLYKSCPSKPRVKDQDFIECYNSELNGILTGFDSAAMNNVIGFIDSYSNHPCGTELEPCEIIPEEGGVSSIWSNLKRKVGLEKEKNQVNASCGYHNDTIDCESVIGNLFSESPITSIDATIDAMSRDPIYMNFTKPEKKYVEKMVFNQYQKYVIQFREENAQECLMISLEQDEITSLRECYTNIISKFSFLNRDIDQQRHDLFIEYNNLQQEAVMLLRNIEKCKVKKGVKYSELDDECVCSNEDEVYEEKGGCRPATRQEMMGKLLDRL